MATGISRVANILKKAKILKTFNQFTGIVIIAKVYVNIDVSSNKKYSANPVYKTVIGWAAKKWSLNNG